MESNVYSFLEMHFCRYPRVYIWQRVYKLINGNFQRPSHTKLDRNRHKAICLRFPPPPPPPSFTPKHSPDNAWWPQIWPVSLSQRDTIMRKINKARPKFNQFWRWSRNISMHNFRPFPPCILREMPGNLPGRTDRWTDGQAEKQSRLIRWTDGPMYIWKEGISGLERTDGRTTQKHNASDA